MNSGSSRKNFIALLVVMLLFVATTATAQTQASRAATAASYFDRGSEWQAKGELDRAISDLGYALCYANRGVAWLMKGSILKAESDFNQCRELAGHLPPHVVQRINELKIQVVGKRPGN
jgi:tetratricopeptide (TPR) repeat protein